MNEVSLIPILRRWWRRALSVPVLFKKWARQREYAKNKRALKRLQRQTRIPSIKPSQFIDGTKAHSDSYMRSLRR